MTKLIKFRI